MRLNDNRDYYPIGENCDGNSGSFELDNNGDLKYFCDVNENDCLTMTSALFVDFDASTAQLSLTVGFEESDTNFNSNDFEFGQVPGSKWYSDDCRPYEVKIYREFKAETQVESCYSISGSAGGNLKGVDVSVEGGFERCSTFTEPAQSYVWLLQVDPQPQTT